MHYEQELVKKLQIEKSDVLVQCRQMEDYVSRLKQEMEEIEKIKKEKIDEAVHSKNENEHLKIEVSTLLR